MLGCFSVLRKQQLHKQDLAKFSFSSPSKATAGRLVSISIKIRSFSGLSGLRVILTRYLGKLSIFCHITTLSHVPPNLLSTQSRTRGGLGRGSKRRTTWNSSVFIKGLLVSSQAGKYHVRRWLVC